MAPALPCCHLHRSLPKLGLSRGRCPSKWMGKLMGQDNGLWCFANTPIDPQILKCLHVHKTNMWLKSLSLNVFNAQTSSYHAMSELFTLPLAVKKPAKCGAGKFGACRSSSRFTMESIIAVKHEPGSNPKNAAAWTPFLWHDLLSPGSILWRYSSWLKVYIKYTESKDFKRYSIYCMWSLWVCSNYGVD